MASRVFHVAMGTELDLERADLGHPELPGLWERLLGRCERGVLECVDFRHDRCDQDCQRWMFLRRSATGRRTAVHLMPAESEWDRGSDEHRALCERIARTAERRGFRVEADAPVGAGRRTRTSVVVHGDGVTLGCEPQLTPVSPTTVRNRSDGAYRSGVTPLWATDSVRTPVINRAPWARIDRMEWRRYTDPHVEMPVRGGYRVLVTGRCTPGTVCNDRKRGQVCSGWNSQFEPRQLRRFDDLIARAAARDLIPVKRQISATRAFYFWAPANDVAQLEVDPRRALVTEIDPPRLIPAPPPLAGTTHVEGLTRRLPPAPLDGGESVPVRRTALSLARELRALENVDAFLAETRARGGRITAEPRRLTDDPPGLIGWAVDLPAGGTVVVRLPDADYRDAASTSIRAPFCEIDGEPWWWCEATGVLASRRPGG